MKKVSVWIMLLIIFIAACDDNEVWKQVEEPEERELLQFLNDYKLTWEESLENQHYSLMEAYFTPNSHVYHMERRQHQQLISERKIERFAEARQIQVEVNQYDEYRIKWIETVEIEQAGTHQTEDRSRSYYISEGRNGYRITAIERNE